MERSGLCNNLQRTSFDDSLRGAATYYDRTTASGHSLPKLDQDDEYGEWKAASGPSLAGPKCDEISGQGHTGSPRIL